MSAEGYSGKGLQVLAASGVNVAATDGPIGTPLTQAGSLAVHLTAVRGQVRRLPEGTAKERASLLAAQLENGVPADMIKRQLAVMAG